MYHCGVVRPLRLEAPGAVYHVIARGNERKAVFRDDRDRERYLDRLAHYRERFGFRLYAYCLMDNHVHLAIQRGPVALSRIMLALQSSYTQWFNRRHSRVGHLFQGRYKAFLVERDRYLLALLRYIHENPVKARVVERPEDHPWSSDRFYRSGRGPSWLDLDDVLRMLAVHRSAAVREYRRLMGDTESEAYDEVRSHAQVVKGDDAFADRVLREAGEARLLRNDLTVGRVAKAVARSEGISMADLQGPGRFRRNARIRAIVALIGRLEARIPASRTARFFNRDESTIVRQVLWLEEEMRQNPRLRTRIRQLTAALR
jgi:putative transposase